MEPLEACVNILRSVASVVWIGLKAILVVVVSLIVLLSGFAAAAVWRDH